MYVDVPDATSMRGCNFTGNSARVGGAMTVLESMSAGGPLASLNVRRSHFVGNRAKEQAGALYVSC